MLSYLDVRDLLNDQRLPVAFVDVDALDRNLDRVLETIRPHGIPLRVASKSVRVVGVLRRLLERGQGMLQGLMCYSCEEAAFLAGHGFDDLLVAYPPFQQSDLEIISRLTEQGLSISVISDCRQSVDRLSEAGRKRGVRIRVVLCVDMSLKLMGGRVVLGVRRSPLHSPEQVVGLARYVADQPGTEFWGLMGYEAQVAGLGDQNPFEPSMNPVKTLVKRVSARELAQRRAHMVEQLVAAGLAPRLVNGGGSGSLDTTTPVTGVSEVTAGSAFFKPHLFDYYKNPHMRRLEPAAFFALEVTRSPGPGLVTCLGGGYVASGPPSPDKVPLPWLPAGLRLLPTEMAGEVQTPLVVPPHLALNLGDPVVFRHAKGGELAERFREMLLVRGGRIEDRVPTYRGEGVCFL